MKGSKLHTALLEQEFGQIRLHILKQENEWRMVHLYDEEYISRTMAIVRFNNYANPVIKASHARIFEGELLGMTLLKDDIPYEKSAAARVAVTLPDWLKAEFRSSVDITMGLYSQISILDRDKNEVFLYADLFEIIPPDILHLFPGTGKMPDIPDKEMISLLNFAGIKTAPTEPNI
ncbi:MAG TPA: hypothetical protein VKN36_18300 [Eudoraea sp.]|nr:hypothetical protein [Eudoraea sp.]